MHRFVSPRSAFVLALAVSAFAAGAMTTMWMPREAHAQAFSSTIQVPREGLTFRAADGRAIARLSYDARGGIFEVLDDHGDAFASMGQSRAAGVRPPTSPTTDWSLDVVRDPWAREGAPASNPRPGSGL